MHINRHPICINLSNRRFVVMRHAVTHQASERWDSEDWPRMKGGTRNLEGRSVSLSPMWGCTTQLSLLACFVRYCFRWHHLSLCSVGCTWPILHLMAFSQAQLPLLTASFKRMRSFPQRQQLKVLYSYRLAQLIFWYQAGNIIQAGCPRV